MSNEVDPKKLEKAPIASSCFMGLGQILFLKQYIRGALFALVEIVMLCAIIFGSKKIIPANNKEYNYLKGIPDTEEIVEYLEDAEYSKLDSVLKARAKAMEKFFNKNAAKASGKPLMNWRSLMQKIESQIKKIIKRRLPRLRKILPLW
ncbi:MAG: hypothetical protein L6V86_07150 [Treponema sp.]|nr:MAG: hypothetical protein L6V86_07150 [Treponema sp.]